MKVLYLRGPLCLKYKLYKYHLIIFTALLSFCFVFAAKAQEIEVNSTPVAKAEKLLGIVVSAETDQPLEGATIKVKGSGITTITSRSGKFSISHKVEKGILEVSFMGYNSQEVSFSNTTGSIKISLEEDQGMLEEAIVSTGYQELEKLRSTGSFEKIDEALLNRRVGTTILEKLDGIASGVQFSTHRNKQRGQSDIEIRGRSTLFSNSDPLVILDNFPYDGDLKNINPNDIESITILKDAASASIWGVRAGNGVIVLTSKKGKLNMQPKVSINSNFTIGERPDLFGLPRLNTTEFIELEKFLFDKGKYTASLRNAYTPVSPVVETLWHLKEGHILQNEADRIIDSIGRYDGEGQYDKYFNRGAFNQQHSMNIKGGGLHQDYFVSVGFDRNLPSDIAFSYNRFTLNANNTYRLLKDKLKINTGILFSSSNNKQASYGASLPRYPYVQYRDEYGNNLAVDANLRISYADTVGAGKLLDWQYRPLDELYGNYVTIDNKKLNYRFSTSVDYNFLDGFNASLSYLFDRGNQENTTHYRLDSYYARDLINKFSYLSPSGEVVRPVPLGDVLQPRNTVSSTHNGRAQITYNKAISANHHLNGIAGFEVKEYAYTTNSFGLYGYSPDNGTNGNGTVDYTDNFSMWHSGSTSRIPTLTSESGVVDRYVSYFTNLIYIYKDRYIFSGSARKDASNLFGVEPNQKGVPLWSAGVGWIASKEDFYGVSWLPFLKLGFTYGYNGNVNKNVSAYLTANPGKSVHHFNLPYYNIVNPPNPSLRWEKIKNVNVSLAFATQNNILTGNIDYWNKKGVDLIGTSPIAPQTGIPSFTGNSASTQSSGIEASLNSHNIDKRIKWTTTYIVNIMRDKVTEYNTSNGSNYNVVTGNFNNPLVGYPYYSIFSFPWAGLDEEGNPQGFLEGEVSNEYLNIENSQNRDELQYHGSAVPTFFGSLRNSFSYGRVNLSFNIMYKAGYYFRRASLDNTSIYSGNTYQAWDYDQRWLAPGDERNTNVPSLIYPANASRDDVYKYSEILIEKGDHIRLQDIQVNVDLGKEVTGIPIHNINIYAYADNLGVLWSANKKGIDPDYPRTISPPRTYAIGVKVDF